MRLKRNHTRAHSGPRPNAITEMCADVEAQIAWTDEWGIHVGQRSMVER
jgi:hypothetical protein